MPHPVVTGLVVALARGRSGRQLTSAAIAVGALALSTTYSLAGCASGNVPANELVASAACQGAAPAFGSTAIGTSAFAKGLLATSLGGASGPRSIVAGATTIGAYAGNLEAGIYSTAIGAGSSANHAPRAHGNYSIAIGGSDDSNLGAVANGTRGIAIGQKSVGGDHGTSVGFNTNTNYGSAAVGTDANASGFSTSAFGRLAAASGDYSLALGVQAVASKSGSVAIGSGSIANVANTVSVGTTTVRRRIVNVANGVGAHDVVTVAQLQAAVAAAPVAMAHPSDNSKSLIEEIRQELSALRSLVQRQEQEIAELKALKTTARFDE